MFGHNELDARLGAIEGTLMSQLDKMWETIDRNGQNLSKQIKQLNGDILIAPEDDQPRAVLERRLKQQEDTIAALQQQVSLLEAEKKAQPKPYFIGTVVGHKIYIEANLDAAKEVASLISNGTGMFYTAPSLSQRWGV